MKWRRPRRGEWIAALGLAGVCAIAWFVVYPYYRQTQPKNRVYRIGWQNNMPSQFSGEDGRPTGIAVEIVREAARRRGIALEWMYHQEGPDAPLRQGTVDLWPLLSITSERKGLVYITEPYMQRGFWFLVPAGSAYGTFQDLSQATVSYVDVPVIRADLHRRMPKALLVARPASPDALGDVCEGHSGAAYLTEHTAIAALLAGGSCAGFALRAIPLPDTRISMGVGATFASRDAADAIRDEISRMWMEGMLPQLLSRWGYFSDVSLESLDKLAESRQRERNLRGGIAAVSVLLLVAVWQAMRIRRERNYSRRTARALRESEESLRTVFAMAPDGMFVADSSGRFIDVNQAACRQLGYERRQLLEGSVNDILPERLRANAATPFGAASDTASFYESCHLRADGTEVPVELSARKITYGGQPAFLGIARDITERRRMSEALADRERRYRLLFSGGADGVFVWVMENGRPGRFQEVNDVACRMLGYTREELLGMAPFDVTAPEALPMGIAAVKELMAEGRAVWEATVVAKDGRRIPVELSDQVFALDGKATVFAIMRDISDRKRAEEERAGLEEQLRQAQKLESVGRLAGGIAHDFNNLLTVINGYTALLTREVAEDDPARAQLEEIAKAGNRAASLTQQLLAFSRRQVIHPKPLDLNAVIAETGKMLQRLVGEDVEITTRLDPSLGQTMADPGQIHQVLMNLAVNARDAMPDGGKLAIATCRARVERSGLAGQPDVAPGEYVLLMVSDTGTGMSEAVQQRIFEPFFTTKGLGLGTGLGLSTVYGIVKQSNGWIAVDSEPGKGSTFRIYLPETGPNSGAAEATELPQAESRGSETILIVEDQENVRKLARRILESCGYHVLDASDGKEALALAERYPGRIRLLLTDVVMPGWNGREVAERLQLRHPGVKVLFMSGYTEEVIAHRGVLDQEVAYIQKPFSPHELAGKVREALRTAAGTPGGG